MALQTVRRYRLRCHPCRYSKCRAILGRRRARKAVSQRTLSSFSANGVCLRLSSFSPRGAWQMPSVRLIISAHAVPKGVPSGVKACISCNKNPGRESSNRPMPTIGFSALPIVLRGVLDQQDDFVLRHPSTRAFNMRCQNFVVRYFRCRRKRRPPSFQPCPCRLQVCFRLRPRSQPDNNNSTRRSNRSSPRSAVRISLLAQVAIMLVTPLTNTGEFVACNDRLSCVRFLDS